VSSFADRLSACSPRRPGTRRWFFVAYDQLSDAIGPWASERPGDTGIVLVETPAKARRRPYHRQKLALVLANLRHFALEQSARGVAVRHVVDDGGYAPALERLARELGTLQAMRPAERELRVELQPLVDQGLLEWAPHDGWLTTADDFAAAGGPPWRMDRFYRAVRRRTGVLMADGKPVGGKLSFDAENRQPWRGEPEAPEPPTFRPDDVTREVGELIERHYADHPGTLQLDRLPASARDAEKLWRWALEHCLPHFGPFEDAMSVGSTGLFHARIAPLLHLHRLLPQRVLDDALAADIPLASKEGFVRQILGWREFVRHVHEATDGLRSLDGEPIAPDILGRGVALPPVFWGKAESGLHCLDRVVADVWREGYSHHITRLMVLGNLATLIGVSPRELTDWFWAAYTDAYDWVVEPNVLAMATFAVGDLMTTKPYVAGSAYIHRMSDYCRDCAFDPKTTCPITRLYWQFLAEHRDHLEGNQRIAMPLRSAAKRKRADTQRDERTSTWVRSTLARGERLDPADAP
jgi:deoxyribodipyrimidine photolyase-related protein